MNSIRSPLYELYKCYFRGFKIEQEHQYFIKLSTPDGTVMDIVTLLNDYDRHAVYEKTGRWIGI